MRLEDALQVIQGKPGRYITHEDMVSGRHAYVRSQEPHRALKLVFFKTWLEQDWVPTSNDLLRADWQVIEEDWQSSEG